MHRHIAKPLDAAVYLEVLDSHTINILRFATQTIYRILINQYLSKIYLLAMLSKIFSNTSPLPRFTVGAPPNSKTPMIIGDLCREMAVEHGLTCTILGQVRAEFNNSVLYKS